MKNETTCEAEPEVDSCRAKRQKIILPNLCETRQINVLTAN